MTSISENHHANIPEFLTCRLVGVCVSVCVSVRLSCPSALMLLMYGWLVGSLVSFSAQDIESYKEMMMVTELAG